MLWEQGAAGSNPATSTRREVRNPVLIDGVFICPQFCHTSPLLVMFTPIRDTEIRDTDSISIKNSTKSSTVGGFITGGGSVKKG